MTVKIVYIGLSLAHTSYNSLKKFHLQPRNEIEIIRIELIEYLVFTIAVTKLKSVKYNTTQPCYLYTKKTAEKITVLNKWCIKNYKKKDYQV